MLDMYELLVVASMLVIGVVIPVVAVLILVAWARRNSSAAANPNLFRCPDCSREVSKRAPACPHCGVPLAAPKG